MKTNGIIRRIDDLGRIVIPREFRRLHGIDLGDPMEIVATADGEIIVRKADTSEELVKIAKKVAAAAADELSGTILVCDFNSWLTGFGQRKNEFVGKPLPQGAERALRERKTITDGGFGAAAVQGSELKFSVLPAAADGDCFGGVGYVSDGAVTKSELAILRVTARVIGEFMRKF